MVSAAQRLRHCRRSDFRCWYCGDYLEELGEGVYLVHLDHIIPKSQGGGNGDDNLVPCCPWCNLHKGTKSLEEFRLVWWRRVYSFSCPQQFQWVAYLIEKSGGRMPRFEDIPPFTFAFEEEGWV